MLSVLKESPTSRMERDSGEPRCFALRLTGAVHPSRWQESKEGIMIIVSSLSENTLLIPINFIFWANVWTYIIHIIEETTISEVFVDKVKRLYFPSYNRHKFFGFNAILLSLNIIAIIVFESIQGAWLIFPLALMFERVFNGIYHFLETIKSKRYSSGLLTSVIVWILLYLLIRYSFLRGEIPGSYFLISLLVGFGVNILMIVPLMAGLYKKM